MTILRCALSALAGLLIQAGMANAAPDSEAREDFLALCADCHNDDARGDGPLAKNLKHVPPDLTRIKERSQGQFDEKAIFDYVIGLSTNDTHGLREMPIWGDWLMDEVLEGNTSLEEAKAAEQEIERRMMGIVRYIGSLQVGESGN